jgi:hypothetical protein
LNPGTEAQGGDFQYQSIPGNDRPPKTRFLDTGEEHEFLIAVCYFPQSQQRATLGQGLNHQDARHDRRTGKMPLEKRFVDADLFDTDDTLERSQFNDPIDQQKGIAMREKLLDGFGVENRFHRFSTINKTGSSGRRRRRGRRVFQIVVADENPGYVDSFRRVHDPLHLAGIDNQGNRVRLGVSIQRFTDIIL